jgi:hypothetical protein
MPSWRLRDVRGEAITFQDPYFVYAASGVGIAPAVHVARRAVYLDGEQFEDGFYDARVLQLGVDILADAAGELPGLRDALYRMLAPLRDGCYLTRVREDATEREILARLVGSLDMPREVRQSGAHQRVVLTLRAAQPHWYDPTATPWVYNAGSGVGSFGFPVGFPAGFGVSAIDVTETKVYGGHIDVYPEIRITGPATDVIIENLTLDTTLDLDALAYEIDPDEVVTIALGGERKTITSSVSGNILEYLSDDSDLGEWRIAAHPAAAGGRNTIRVRLQGATNATEVVIQFNTLYAGV